MAVDMTGTAQLAAAIEHTLLAPGATELHLERLCAQAIRWRLGGVCVAPTRVAWCRRRLAGCNVRVVTVVGFPSGAHLSAVKALEAQLAVAEGADELDMVVDIAALKEGDQRRVARDLATVVASAAGRPVKAILETALLDDAEKRLACRIAGDAGARFVKTSTGFAGAGASIEDVRLMRETVGDRLGVKASGGIRDLGFARALMAAGADRIGTSQGDQLMAAACAGYDPASGAVEPRPSRD
jgi:deoxyribose-phosphate aldolase